MAVLSVFFYSTSTFV